MIRLDDFLAKYKTIAVWGVGTAFRDSYKNNFPIKYLVDSDCGKWGEMICGVKIYSPNEFFESLTPDSVAIIVCSNFYHEIIQSIRERKIACDIFLPCMIMPNPLQAKNMPYIESFSPYGEDVIIWNLAKKYNVSIDCYLDVGANAPIKGIATFLFYLNGAMGGLVEPNREFEKALRLCRPKDLVIMSGVGSGGDSQTKAMTYYKVKGKTWRNTFCKDVAEEYQQQGFEILEEKVEIRDINLILADYDKHVNYINIDVEGYEYNILSGFDWDRYSPEFFNIEKGNEKVKELCLNAGYLLLAETPSNWIFGRKDIII